MSTIEALIQELEQEATTTRRVLERVPEDKLGWKPHQKSRSLGELALHIAQTPGGISDAVRQPRHQAQFKEATATSTAELLSTLDAGVAKAKDNLRAIGDAGLGNLWRLVDGDHEIVAMPVGAALRTVMLNHWYHHRGQLSVYLRELNVPLPSIYGPTADENPFAKPATTTA
ncbi:MAG TPA: DinB family protein [Vicinamibacterales bacterium]|jgi:uncharacterized damage-inducible protein DinB|nr:DinB family protein [Vicinamibacterales bacterium]